jgi:hypothetical protein
VKKTLLIASLLISATLTMTAQTGKGSIEGRVLRTTDSSPIADSLVQLILPNAAPANLSPEALQALREQLENARRSTLIAGRAREESEALTLGAAANEPLFFLTDTSGRFTFRNVPPGRYTLRVSGTGAIGPMKNGSYQTGVERAVNVEPDKTISDLVFKLIPGVIVGGRVFDPQGQPALGVPVAEYRLIYRNGAEVWAQGGTTTTNDRGEYRIGITAPGDLYIAVNPRNIPGPQETWARTFYPNATEPEGATKIFAPEGSQTTTLDIQIQKRPATTYRISGRALNPIAPVNPATGVADPSISTFYLASRKPNVFITPPAFPNTIPLGSRPNGEFEIRDVPPGSYELIALATDPTTRRSAQARIPVEVRNEDLRGIAPVFGPALAVNGEIQVRGSGAGTLKFEPGLSIVLASQGPFPFDVNIPTTTQPTFSVDRVFADRYRLDVRAGLPPTAYVADVRRAGASVFDEGFDISDSANPIQIVVDTDGQTVTGIVTNSKGEPLDQGTVVLIPPDGQRKNMLRYKTGVIDATGHFTIRGVPPNRYTVLAWESIFPSTWMNEKAMAKYADRAKPLTVTPGSRNDLQLEGILTGN